MKRILYIDLVTTIGHRKFNQSAIKALRRSFEILTISREKALGDAPDIVIPDRFFNFSNRLDLRVKELEKIDWVIENTKQFTNFDLVLFSSYETISFSIKSRQIVKLWKNVAVFDHNNIDEIEKSIIKKLFFSSIDHKISHLVFEEYFRNYLVKDVRIKNRVVVLPHPVEDKNKPFQPSKTNITVFVPSNKHDYEYIKKIIATSPSDICFFVKSDKILPGNNVKTMQLLENDEYENAFANCDLILLPLTTEYNYRISNIIFECFSYSKPCFTFRNKLSEFLSQVYPNVIHIIDRNIYMNEILQKYHAINEDAFLMERRTFLNSHSEEAFLKGIVNLFGDISSQDSIL